MDRSKWNCQLGRYNLLDYSQQKTPNESQDCGLLRVAHPQHSLNRQIVKVLKREGRHWIIEKADGSQEKLPLAWAETVPSIIAQANRQDEPWAGGVPLVVRLVDPR